MDESLNEDAAVTAWLAAKFRLSRSEKTLSDYRNTMRRFRAFLAEQGLGLDPWRDLAENATDRERRRALGAFALKIQEFAERPTRDKPIAPRTYNAYLEAISSFYQFCNKYDLLFCGNPCERVERARVQQYQGARALDIDQVAARIRAIDQATHKGCRDYAMICILLETGRRISEVLNMQWKHLTLHADGSLEIFFPRTKGGKTKRDLLSQETSRVLLAWVNREYKEKPKANSWIWVNLSYVAAGQHLKLSYSNIREIMAERLGTTSVHRTRHTWSIAMKKLGASIDERKEGLGHGSILTTQIYDAALSEETNPRREALAQLFGIHGTYQESEASSNG